MKTISPTEQELVSLLEQQRELYQSLRQLTERQKSLVLGDDTTALLGLLAQRQSLVDGLVSLNRSLAPYRQQWAATVARLTEPVRKHVTELIEEANQSLGGILQSDNRDTATLNARREDLVARLATADQAGRVGAAYARTTVAPSGLTDARA
jgi:hypothetical protein